MISVLIVDDEKPAREEMRYLLDKHGDVEIIGEAGSVQEALGLVHERMPDLVMLDIQMPGTNGFQFVEHLSDEDILPAIVFVTAYDDFAVHAFEISATDYLLKPVDEERLAESLDRVRKNLKPSISQEELLRLVRQLEGGAPARSDRPPRLSVRKGDRFLLVDPAEVTHGYILDGVVFLATPKFIGMTAHRTLEELEADLDPRTFWRVHRSYVVNLSHVIEVIPGQSGTYRLRIDDEKKTLVPLSRAQAKRLRKVLRW